MVARHVFPDREGASVDIYAGVVQASTLASVLLDKALMKLSVCLTFRSHLNICCLFLMPQKMAPREAGVWKEEERGAAPVAFLCYQEFGELNSRSVSWRCLPRYIGRFCQTLWAGDAGHTFLPLGAFQRASRSI